MNENDEIMEQSKLLNNGEINENNL